MPEHCCVCLVTNSPEETTELGRQLGSELRRGDVVLLVGQFGAGKTTFAQGIAMGMGVAEYITSPSFTLVNEYRPDTQANHLPLYHVDLYRVSGADEALDFGLDEYLYGDGVCVVEWAERASEALADAHILVNFRIKDDSREIVLCTRGRRHLPDLEAFATTWCRSDKSYASGG